MQQFYHKENLDLNAIEDIRAEEIEQGNQRVLLETLIILCSLVKLYNEETYDEVRDYFQTKVSISENQDFFIYVDDVYRDIKILKENSKMYNNQNMIEMKKQKENEDTRHLLDLISNKNDIIQKLQKENKGLQSDIGKYMDKIKEMTDFIEKNQHQQEESTKNLHMQESIFENKMKLMEEDLAKQKDDYERRIKKIVTNHDLEKQKVKVLANNWKEEKSSLQKEIKKLYNEKKITEKNFNLKNLDMTDLKKENITLKNKVKSLEIKNKSSVNWKNRWEKLKAENKTLNKLIDELEAKITVIDRQNINDKQVFGMSMSRNSRNRLDLDGLVNNITSTANNEISDEPSTRSQFRMRESEVNLDIYEDMDNLMEHVEENFEYYGPRDTIPAMNVSPINQMNLQELMAKENKNVKEIPQKIPEEDHKIPEDHISMEEAGVLYSAVSEYLVHHLDMVDYYTSKQTRERDIMKPFVIEQFFK
jgi:chromosome segregation ATPase